jgi:DmsE family decaheme c-type cytochrome
MRELLRSISVIGILALIVLAVGPVGGEPDPPAAGIGICGDCHDETETSFQTVMCALHGAGYPTCESCHDNAAAHAEEGDPELVTIPQRDQLATLCRTCHNGPEHTLAGTQVHATADVACVDCHDVHPDQELTAAKLLRAEPAELCISCHKAQEMSFRKPYGHRLEPGGVQCISCHNPHGGPGERSLKQDRSGQGPCVTCHAEKRGPFVFPHVSGVTGDCQSCHEVHGSANPKRLTRSRVDQLCLECHSTITSGLAGSQPPSFHDLRSARYRECTVCHVSIHGSNSSPELLR